MYNHDFKKSFSVEHNGEEISIDHIDMIAPSAKCRNACFSIRREYDNAFKKAEQASLEIASKLDPEMMKIAMNSDAVREAKEAKDDSKAEEKEISKEDLAKNIIQTLHDGDANFDIIANSIQSILSTTKSKFNGEHKAVIGLFEAIPYSELDDLIGAYIANFILS